MFEANDLCFREIFFELENVADVRASPGINRLILIADGASFKGNVDMDV